MDDTLPYTVAIIPTNGRACLKQCIEAVYPQVHRIILVEGGSGAQMLDGLEFTIIREPEINISRWWNLGISLVASWVKDQEAVNPKWNLVILNDDAIIPPGWVHAVSSHMRSLKGAAGCSGTPYPMPSLHTHPGPVDLSTRLQGFAFILAGEKGVRANEQLKWYFSDDHVDWLSRQQGGTVNIPGFPVRHLYPNAQVTPEIQEQIARDAEAFSAYWGGKRPW